MGKKKKNSFSMLFMYLCLPCGWACMISCLGEKWGIRIQKGYLSLISQGVEIVCWLGCIGLPWCMISCVEGVKRSVPLALSSLCRSRAALVLTSASANSALDWSVTFPDCHNDQLGMNSFCCVSVYVSFLCLILCMRR